LSDFFFGIALLFFFFILNISKFMTLISFALLFSRNFSNSTN